MSPEELERAARALAPQMVADRRQLHRHPELAGRERETAAYIASRLRDLGLEPRLLLGETAVCADIRGGGGPGRALLVRADIDALPIQERDPERPYRSLSEGVMHACGHDGHVAIALATAELLRERRAEFPGLARLVFQPAEEVAGGAAPMIEAGVMESPPIEGVIGLHLWSGQPVGRVGVRAGTFCASADEFGLEVRGRGGHGALPHQALDPVPIASLVVLGLQTLVSRETSPLESAVVTVGQVSAGQAFNVIPETVLLRGTVRAFTEEDRGRLLRRIGEVGAGIASAFGASVRQIEGPGCPPVVCDPAMAELVRRAAATVPGADVFEPDPLPIGDDVGLFLRRAPGCYFMLGAGDPPRGISAPHHHPDFDIDEACLPLGAQVMTRSALDFLTAGPG